MMQRILTAAGIMIACTLAPAAVTAAAAQEQSDPNAVAKLADESVDLVKKGNISGALAKLDKALKLAPLPGQQRGAIQYLRTVLLLRIDRLQDALDAISEAAVMLPEAQTYELLAQVQIFNERYAEASQTIVLIADRFPEKLTEFDQNLVFQIISKLDANTQADARFEMVLALANRDYGNSQSPGRADFLKQKSILGLLERGRKGEAEKILSSMVRSSTLLSMMIDRRFQELWPQIENKTGPDLAQQFATELSALEAAHRQQPNSYYILTDYMTALRVAGRPKDAAAAADAVLPGMNVIAKTGEPAFWAVNEQMYALAESGRLDDADKLMATLLKLDIQEHADLVSMAINRGEVLLMFNRPEAALQAAAWVEKNSQGAISEYGRMWILSNKSCALQALGKRDEAEAMLKTMAAHKSDNPSAYLLTLLYHDRLDEAEKVVLESLADEDERITMLTTLQDFAGDANDTRFGPFISRLKSLRQRTAVRQAIDTAGRILTVAARRSHWGGI